MIQKYSLEKKYIQKLFYKEHLIYQSKKKKLIQYIIDEC